MYGRPWWRRLTLRFYGGLHDSARRGASQDSYTLHELGHPRGGTCGHTPCWRRFGVYTPASTRLGVPPGRNDARSGARVSRVPRGSGLSWLAYLVPFAAMRRVEESGTITKLHGTRANTVSWSTPLGWLESPLAWGGLYATRYPRN